MPAINFPASPSVNDTFTSSGKTWKWNGTFWELVVSGASVADGSVSTAKISDAAITNPKLASGAVHSVNIASGAVTAAKLGNDIQLTPPDGSITQAKLAASLSGITVTTTANRGTAVPSPFTGQTIFLTDVKRMQVWDGSAWMFMTVGVPDAPTSLSATPLSTTSVSIAFTAGSQNGSIISNYKYALSTNGGSTYGEYAAISPSDAVSPITISGLTGATTYHIKLKAVADFGDSVDSSAVSVTTLTPPNAPTSLSATALNGTSVSIAFTAGATGGSAFTNMEYALSTNSGVTYGAYTAFSPADYTTPVVISGLTGNTQYTIKLRHITTAGTGPDSSAVTITTPIDVDYLVVAGGGAGTGYIGGGGGAGGYRSSVDATGGGGALESALTLTLATNYSVTIGAGATGTTGSTVVSGSNSVFSTITSTGGGGGAPYSNGTGASGGSGGGGGMLEGSGLGGLGGTPTSGQGYAGGRGGSRPGGTYEGCGGGGGAGGVGSNGTGSTVATFGGNGGVGLASSITGSSIFRGGGGGGCLYASDTRGGTGGNGGGGQGSSTSLSNAVSGTANTGGGGGGQAGATGGSGGSGVVILRYPATATITLGAGLTGSTTTVGSNKVTTITAGSGNVSWS